MKAVWRFIGDRPWIWIIVAFALLLSGLATVVVIAEKNQPASVPLEEAPE